ncbi:MAG: TlpA family protein disulfide reductase [Jatrophihabitans sp.]|nr:MAG: TlpA family protein disulfide reductase [Jatrophihabitans sp.]
MNARVLLAGLLAVAVVGTACTGKDAVNRTAGNQFRFVGGTATGRTYPVADRKPAGDFSEPLLDGKGTFTLSRERGKVVVVNFWATWCGPCQVETPQFDTVYRQYQASHPGAVAFVGIDTKDQRGDAETFVRHYDISYPIVFDEPGETAIRLGKIPALGLPFTVLIDRSGRVAGVYLNVMTPADLEPLLDTLLAEP